MRDVNGSFFLRFGSMERGLRCFTVQVRVRGLAVEEGVSDMDGEASSRDGQTRSTESVRERFETERAKRLCVRVMRPRTMMHCKSDGKGYDSGKPCKPTNW